VVARLLIDNIGILRVHERAKVIALTRDYLSATKSVEDPPDTPSGDNSTKHESNSDSHYLGRHIQTVVQSLIISNPEDAPKKEERAADELGPQADMPNEGAAEEEPKKKKKNSSGKNKKPAYFLLSTHQNIW
jgi:hypothetical protein